MDGGKIDIVTKKIGLLCWSDGVFIFDHCIMLAMVCVSPQLTLVMLLCVITAFRDGSSAFMKLL